MTATTFGERDANHTSSFRHKKDSNNTELSKHIWKLKENNQDYTIKWSILKHAISYTGGSKRCNSCLVEILHFERHKQRQFTQYKKRNFRQVSSQKSVSSKQDR
jgi:hypothetical protein